ESLRGLLSIVKKIMLRQSQSIRSLGRAWSTCSKRHQLSGMNHILPSRWRRNAGEKYLNASSRPSGSEGAELKWRRTRKASERRSLVALGIAAPVHELPTCQAI